MGDVVYKTHEKTNKIFYGYRQNIHFYENLELQKYESFAKASGLSDREDVLALLPYLSNATSILEVGAGFGRAVDALLCFCKEAKIMALEICPHMCHFMQRRYRDDLNVKVLCADFLSSSLKHQSFDLITFFWSTLTSFCLEEQQRCFFRAFNLLQKNGRLAIDLFESSKEKEHANLKLGESGSKIWTTRVLGRNVFGWMPQGKLLISMAKKAGLDLEKRFVYHANDVNRSFFIFVKRT